MTLLKMAGHIGNHDIHEIVAKRKVTASRDLNGRICTAGSDCVRLGRGGDEEKNLRSQIIDIGLGYGTPALHGTGANGHLDHDAVGNLGTISFGFKSLRRL
jgi:hypothetical protein